MTNLWNNSGLASAVDIRLGPGNNWALLDRNGAIDGGISGSGRDRTTLWGRDEFKGLTPRGFVSTSNPKDWKIKYTYPLSNENFLKQLGDCPFDLRIRQWCAPNLTNMAEFVSPGMLGYREITSTEDGYDNSPAVSDGQAKEVKRTGSGMATLEQRYARLTHLDVSQATNDVGNTDIIQIGARVCAGACGLETTEEASWAWVTAKDSTPVYSGNPVPWFFYTVDGFATRTGVRIDPFTNADTTAVIMMGSRFVVFSSTKAPAYANFADIVNGVVAPNLWFTASGFSAITGSNFPIAAYAINANIAFAVGATGRIWQTTDGGITWTLIDNGATSAVNYASIDGQPDGNIYIGGASGVLVRGIRIANSNSYAFSVVTVRDASGNTLSSNINVVATPPTRGDEVDVGTAGGEIWRTRNGLATRPVFTNMPLDKKGNGQVIDIKFSGYKGDVMWVVQNDANGNSRVILDLSGSALATDQRFIGDFVTPGNNGFKSLATCNPNFSAVVGNSHSGAGYIGTILSAG